MKKRFSLISSYLIILPSSPHTSAVHTLPHCLSVLFSTSTEFQHLEFIAFVITDDVILVARGFWLMSNQALNDLNNGLSSHYVNYDVKMLTLKGLVPLNITPAFLIFMGMCGVQNYNQ